MQKKDLRIVFLGTPLFAATTLQALIDNDFNIVAVITAPDKPAGRGMLLQQSEVKKCALENNIPLLQPEKLKADSFLQELKSYNANLQIVVAFRMLPEVVWHMPPMGTINLHASLLPNYRGAAPINWAIINGEKETGVTTFKLVHEIDKGNILLQEITTIVEKETVGTLHDKLMLQGAALMVKTIEQILANQITETPQVVKDTDKHAPKLFTATCQIDWNNTAENIHQLVKGLSPFPTAFCSFQEKKLKVFASTFSTPKNIGTAIGHFETDGKTYLQFAAIDGYVSLLDVQWEGKKRMPIADFLRGIKL